MTPAEKEMLADHMGHTLNIHTSVYKMQQNMIERSKVARVLTMFEEGSLQWQKDFTQLESIPLSKLHGESHVICVDQSWVYFCSTPQGRSGEEL